MKALRKFAKRLLLLAGLLLIALAFLQPDAGTLGRWAERLGFTLPVAMSPRPPGPEPRAADSAPSVSVPSPPASAVPDERDGLVAPVSLPATFEARVAKVRDGDTIDVLLGDGRTVRVRLHGIDAPEFGQRFHRQATAFVRERIGGQRVRVERVDVDQFDRLIGQVWIADQRFNAEIVRAGWAWRYRQFAPDDAELQAAESQAREAKRGLWADPQPLPPWVWRRQNRR